MQKPQGYDTTEAATGERRILPPGGYICQVVSAKVERTQSDKEVLRIAYDIHEGEYKGFYTAAFDAKVAGGNLDAKWPGVYSQLTEGKSLPFFKGVITSVEQSNPNYVWNWDEKSLKGKLFGGIVGEEEYRGNDGKVHTGTKLRFIRSVEQIRKGVQIPDKKTLQGASSMGADVSSKEEENFNW